MVENKENIFFVDFDNGEGGLAVLVTIFWIVDSIWKAFFQSKDNVTEAAKTVIETITKTL